MSTPVIKGEPLAVWDSRRMDDGLFWQNWRETSQWAMAHIGDANSTYRAEFYILDAPFVVVWRYKRNEDGRLYNDPPAGEIARSEPVVQMLDELPPAHLLGK